MKRVGGVAAIAAAGLVVLAGCGSDLESDDPQGYKACEYFDKSVAGYGDVEEGLGNQLLAGEAASKAKTQAIRESATSMADGIEDAPNTIQDTYLVDREALRAACADAGFEFKN